MENQEESDFSKHCEVLFGAREESAVTVDLQIEDVLTNEQSAGYAAFVDDKENNLVAKNTN